MLRTLLVAFFSVVTPTILPAQIQSPEGSAVGIGHLHLRVSEADYAEHKRMLVEGLGARAATLGRLEAFLIPDVVILVSQGNLEGGSVGTAVNHIGFTVKDLAAAEAKWKAAGGVLLPDKPNPSQSYVELPGGTKVELSENPSQSEAIKNHHIHFFTGSDTETQAWYIKMFSVTANTRGRFKTGDLLGGELTFAVSETPVTGTKGHAVDHIGFEVNNLEDFCKKLEANGAKLDSAFRSVPQLGLSIAFLTDPWGGYIELTEGLTQLK